MVKRKRPKVVGGKTYEAVTGCGKIYITVNSDEEGPIEVFAALGKAGGCTSCQNEAISRLASLALRYRVPIDQIIRQIGGIRCPYPIPFPKEEEILSCPDAVAKVLKTILEGTPK